MEQWNMVEYDRRGSYFKFAIRFILILLIATGSYIGLKSWQIYQGQREVAGIQHRIEQILAERDRAMRADTVGGTTPQETLQMYITAVEKGDYELASKYFVHDKQDTELESFRESENVSPDKIKAYLSQLRSSLKLNGNYSEDKEYFSFDGMILINLKRYPSGVWKIIEI
jgi:hypothetical protein